MSYAILPRGIENGSGIIDGIYKQMCMINLLRGKHKLIPDCKFKKFNFSKTEGKERLNDTETGCGDVLDANRYSFVPLSFSGEDLELIYLYERDEIASYQQEIQQLLKSREGGQHYFAFLKRIAVKDHAGSRYFTLPVPCFFGQNLYRYEEIASKLSENKSWIEELVKFYAFLTGELIQVDIHGLKPGDFLYDRAGNLKYFLGYHSLTLKADSQGLLENNLNSLAQLLYHYYIEDTEKQQAKLYQQSWFEKIEGRLIEPLVYGETAHKLYQDFTEILADLKGGASYSLSRKRIGVFLDVANIFTPMYFAGDKMMINFDRLLAKIYGRIESRKIRKKVAVIFLPGYEGMRGEYIFELILNIKEYLEEYSFKVITVESDSLKAKTIVEGREVDLDDLKLLEIMRDSRDEVDSILLLTGDRHFYNLAREFQEEGKEVKIISVSPESTYKGFIKNFKHSYLDEYWDCIEFIHNEIE